MGKQMKKQKIPDGSSIEELAQFWDTHDATDYWDELEEVTEPIFDPQLRRTMIIQLEPGEARTVESIAKARGVQKAELLRGWVLEGIGHDKSRRA
jgi:CopG antitoxin of type II toxin-antitoxin system